MLHGFRTQVRELVGDAGWHNDDLAGPCLEGFVTERKGQRPRLNDEDLSIGMGVRDGPRPGGVADTKNETATSP